MFKSLLFQIRLFFFLIYTVHQMLDMYCMAVSVLRDGENNPKCPAPVFLQVGMLSPSMRFPWEICTPQASPSPPFVTDKLY